MDTERVLLKMPFVRPNYTVAGQGAAVTGDIGVLGQEVEKGSFGKGPRVRVLPFHAFIFRLCAAWQVEERLQPLPRAHRVKPGRCTWPRFSRHTGLSYLS